MNGFMIANVKFPDTLREYDGTARYARVGEFFVCYQPDEKFPEDKVFYENDAYFILLDGVILNARELKETHKVKDMASLCLALLQKEGDTFFDGFIGNYAGVCYDKKSNRLTVFTNKLSSRQVFYYAKNHVFIASTLITDIKDVLRHHGMAYSFNKDAAYLMLNYGCMGTDDTFVREVKKIEAGHEIIFDGKDAADRCYHRFTNHAYHLSGASEEEIISGIDERFRRAIDREYQKDTEAGWSYHLRTLTGGTDSRACAFVSHDLGYKNAVNLTYGVPERPDEVIARQIAEYLGNNFIYMSNLPMGDEASFICNIDEAVYKSQGQLYYLGIAQSTTQRIELDKLSYGLSHGGAFSEAFLTTGVLSDPKMSTPVVPLHTYSDILQTKFPNEHLKQYENEDIYDIYSIFFGKFVPTGMDLVNSNMNTVYPGLDIDLVEYCLSIPIEKRKHYYIYHKWLFEAYPDAASFKLEKLNAKPTDGRLKKYYGHIMRYGDVFQYFRNSKDALPAILQKRFDLKKKIKPSSNALMPFDWWFASDPKVRKYMRHYLKENIKNPVIDRELREDLIYMYKKGLAREKSMALTVVAAAKLFF